MSNLTSWNPFREADRNWNDFFDHPSRFFDNGSTPKVDVFQTDKDVVVKAEIPGVSRKDLSLYIDENSIRLSGQTKKEEEVHKEDVYRTERYFGSFSRAIPFPVEVKSENAKAEYRDGILTVTVPKAEPSSSRGRKIDIQ